MREHAVLERSPVSLIQPRARAWLLGVLAESNYRDEMKIISSKELITTPIFSVTMDHAVDPDGFEIKRAIVQHQGSAVVMPVDEKKRVLLVRQYRLPAKQYLWELPAGRVDPGETPLRAARRELKEETGYKAKTLEKLAVFYPSPGFLAEKMTIY